MPTPLPLRIDVFAMLMFLGIAQGLFLSFFFITRKGDKSLSNKFLGLLILSISLAATEVFLCYTNLMFHTLHLIDFAEPTNFLSSSLAYLYLKTKLSNRFDKKQYWHFAPFIFYLIYVCVLFYPQSIAHKYNSYISAYHPQLTFVEDNMYLPYPTVFFFKDYVNELMILQFLIYIMLSFVLIYNEFKKASLSFWSKQNPTLTWCRNIFLQMLSVIIVFIIVKSIFHNDLGDHILSAHITLVIYAISFRVIRQSAFFHPIKEETATQKEERRPYEKSTLTPEIEENTLQKLQELMQSQKPFLSSDFSLPSFAKMLKVSPHHLSQILNESLQQNFFEFAAHYRIAEAKKILVEKDTANLKIEEIAEMVGYNSKSAFNTSFKKIVGLTPSEFRKEKQS